MLNFFLLFSAFSFLFSSALDPEILIEFDEFPQDTTITDQYKPLGIEFSNAFITQDAAHPETPVLSGKTPLLTRFEGDIFGYFQFPVSYFELTGGYYNAVGTTKLTLYDKDTNILDTWVNTIVGVETVEFTQNNFPQIIDVSYWEIGNIVFGTDRYAIDNVGFSEYVSVPDIVGGGDPEYQTIDGLHFEYNGPCQYLLLSNDCGNNTFLNSRFNIITRHGRSRSKEKQIHVISDVIIQAGSYNLRFSNNGNVYINDKKFNISSSKELPGINIKLLNEKNKKNIFERRFEIKTFFGFYLKLSLHGSGTIWLDIDNNIDTCGMLGNNNGNVADDLISKDGTIYYEQNQKNIDLMADSWMLPYEQQPMICDIYPQSSYTDFKTCQNYDYSEIKSICGRYIDMQSEIIEGFYIPQCFLNYEYDNIDLTRLYDDCITEYCSCKSKKLTKCYPHKTMELFEDTCTTNGVKFNSVELNSWL